MSDKEFYATTYDTTHNSQNPNYSLYADEQHQGATSENDASVLSRSQTSLTVGAPPAALLPDTPTLPPERMSLPPQFRSFERAFEKYQTSYEKYQNPGFSGHPVERRGTDSSYASATFKRPLSLFSPPAEKLEFTEKSQEPVSRKELWGWYSYAWASEPFSVVAMSLFVPIILQSMATRLGYLHDHVTRCSTTSELCEINIFMNLWISTASFPFYVVSLSILIQAVLFISLGALADHGNRRKVFLLGFSAAGSIATMMFVLVINEDFFWLVILLTIVANVCFGASCVFFLGYLPTLTRYHPQVLAAQHTKSYDNIMNTMESVASRTSANGMAIGYTSGLLLLMICIALIYTHLDNGSFPLQICCALAGAWWFVFSTFTFMWLKPRSGPPLPENASYLTYSWKQTFKTIRNLRQLSQIFKFLLAWFFLADALTTMVTLAVLFGHTVLKMNELQLMIAAAIVPLAAMVGTYVWLGIQRLFKLSSKTVLLITVGMFSLLPVYALCGFVAPFGLRSVGEVWAICVYHGLLLGPIQSYSRVLYAELVPAGKENEFFAFYQVTEKASAWIGPLITGAIGGLTHDLRHSFWFIWFLLLVPLFLLSQVKQKVSKQETENFVVNEKYQRML